VPSFLNDSSSRASQESQISDAQAIERIRAGEGAFFEVLMRRHNRRVFRATRAILRRDDEAEDVMQEAYVRAYEHLAEFRGDASFATWLTRIAVHEAMARARRERRIAPLDQQPEESENMLAEAHRTPEQLVNDGEPRGVLEKAIDALPDDFRIVFVLRVAEQMSGAETGECLGIPEEPVKTRLHRARLRLQQNVVGSLEACARGAYDFHLRRCDRVVHAVVERLGLPPRAGHTRPAAPAE
jgi:RNA polymerase sigma-70 factor (ECF subfamily)